MGLRMPHIAVPESGRVDSTDDGDDLAGPANPRRVQHISTGSGGDALGRQREQVDRRGVVAAEVLDGTARQPSADRDADRVGDLIRFLGEAVLQVRRHRQVNPADDHLRMLQRFCPGDRTVENAQCRGETAAGGGQCAEAQPAEQPRRTDIPRDWAATAAPLRGAWPGPALPELRSSN